MFLSLSSRSNLSPKNLCHLCKKTQKNKQQSQDLNPQLGFRIWILRLFALLDLKTLLRQNQPVLSGPVMRFKMLLLSQFELQFLLNAADGT